MTKPKLPTKSKPKVARDWRTALHEAGHAIAAYKLGAPLGEVSIVKGKAFDGAAYLGITHTPEDPHVMRRALDEYYDCEDEMGDADAERRREDESLTWIVRHVQVAYGGKLAEELFFGAAEPHGWEDDGESINTCVARACPPDHLEQPPPAPPGTPYKKLLEIANAALAAMPPRESELFSDWLELRARKLLRHHKAIVEAVARELLKKKTLGPTEVHEVVNAPNERAFQALRRKSLRKAT